MAQAVPAQRRAPVRLAQGTATGPETKGYLCAQDGLFNLHAARRVAPNDRQGREMPCWYILRPPLANERRHLSEDGDLTLEFIRPCKDGSRSIALEPEALLARLSAIVPPPRRHVILYFGVLSAHSQWRSQVVPRPKEEPETEAVPEGELPNPASVDAEPVQGAGSRNRYIFWHELLRRTFGSEVVCRDDQLDVGIETCVTAVASLIVEGTRSGQVPFGPPEVVFIPTAANP